MTMVTGIPQTESCEELDWLFNLFGEGRSAPVRYLARPNLDDLRLLVPTAPRAAAVAALRRPHDDRGWRERAQAMAGQVAGRLGQLHRAPGVALTLPPFALVEELAAQLGQPELVAAVTIGARRRNRKPVLQLIRPDGRVVGFAKIGWSDLTREMVTNEYRVLRAVEGTLPEGIVAPTVLLAEEGDDLVVAVTAELRPPRFDRGQGPTNAEVVRAIAAAGPTTGRASWPGTPFARSTVAASATVADAVAVGVDGLVDLDRLVAAHGETELPVGLWHGDFTPWNLVRRGSTLLLWDWELAGWDRPVGFDALHHTFEAHRRRGVGTPAALAALMEAAPGVLAGLELGLDRTQEQALIDLYLCELAVRERRLADQRWSGGTLADLGPHVALLLAENLL